MGGKTSNEWKKAHYHKVKHRYKKRASEYYYKNKVVIAERNKKARLKKRYGLTVQLYNALLALQNWVCAICERPGDNGTKLAVDHCHRTNRIRGLLCRKCNAGLGSLGDTATSLGRAVIYLKAFEKRP